MNEISNSFNKSLDFHEQSEKYIIIMYNGKTSFDVLYMGMYMYVTWKLYM